MGGVNVERAVEVNAWTIGIKLDRPVSLGRWQITEREYTVVEIAFLGAR